MGIGELQAEGFLEAKARQKLDVDEMRKEDDLRRMSMMLPNTFFKELQVDIHKNSLSKEKQEEEIIGTIKKYFSDCQTTTTLPTSNGLAACLNITRKQLKEMKHGTDRISIAIRKSLQAISAYAEEKILEGKPSQGFAFWLKNNDDWVDSHEVKHSDKTMGEIMDEMREKGDIVQGEIIQQEEPTEELPTLENLKEEDYE